MSKREELEARIREQRVLEANKKGLVGVSGKIGVVLKSLGQDIVSQGYADDVLGWGDGVEPRNASEFMKTIPTIEVDGNQRPETNEWGEIGEEIPYSTRKIGIHFDGLGRGMHMEIMYDEDKSELSLTHKGFLAYREVMGEIDTYIPNDEWEGWIDRLFKTAKEIQRRNKEVEFNNNALAAEREKLAWWESMKKKWGLS